MENNNNQKKSWRTTALIIFLLLVTIVAVILATYAWAKYTETFNGEATAQVAKWEVEATQGTMKFSQEFEHVVENKIAPGTDGTISASVDIKNTEVDVRYTITLDKLVPVKLVDGEVVEITNAEEAKNVIPENLIIKDSKGNTIYKNKAIVSGTDGVIATDIIERGSAKVTKEFAWEWPYETPGEGETDAEKAAATKANNEQDTEDGKKAGSFKILYRIDAVQVDPNEPTQQTEEP